MSIEPLKPDELLAQGRYKIIKVLAKGGFAITYEAFDTRPTEQRVVVIKEHAYPEACHRVSGTRSVKPHAGKEALHQKLIERVIREAEILQRFAHPHLVKVEAAWEDFGTAYYAMTRLKGATLADDVSQAAVDGIWNEARSSAIQLVALQLLAALAAAHEHHVFHCDVKPQNTMVTPKGLVLFDFGAARPEESLAQTVTLVPYTPGYAAPELQSPYTIKDVGPWSDLYRLGHDRLRPGAWPRPV